MKYLEFTVGADRRGAEVLHDVFKSCRSLCPSHEQHVADAPKYTMAWCKLMAACDAAARGDDNGPSITARLRELAYAATPHVGDVYPQRAKVESPVITTPGGVAVMFTAFRRGTDNFVSVGIAFGRDSSRLAGEMIAALRRHGIDQRIDPTRLRQWNWARLQPETHPAACVARDA